MRVTSTPIPEVKIVTNDIHHDDRGFFREAYNASSLAASGVSFECVQVNHSLSQSVGTIRGLHFQAPPMASSKLVRVVAGAIFDVAVDIRRDSSSFGEFVTKELNEDQQQMLYVPRGFAHGFCTLAPNTLVEYLTDAHWSSTIDRGVRWDDPSIGIPWPLDGDPVLSPRDQVLPFLTDTEQYGWKDQ